MLDCGMHMGYNDDVGNTSEWLFCFFVIVHVLLLPPPLPFYGSLVFVTGLPGWAGTRKVKQEAQLTLWVADRTAPSHTSTVTRYVFERSTRSVDKGSSYLQELVWQPSWQLDNCPDRLNCASVYMVNCELCTASAQRPVPTAGHAHALWSRGPLLSSQILNNISDMGFQSFTQRNANE